MVGVVGSGLSAVFSAVVVLLGVWMGVGRMFVVEVADGVDLPGGLVVVDDILRLSMAAHMRRNCASALVLWMVFGARAVACLLCIKRAASSGVPWCEI